MSVILPLLFLLVFLIAFFKKVKLYDCFVEGVKGAIPLVCSLFPYLCAILILSELFEQSGLSRLFTTALSPLFSAIGVPPELCPLLLTKPFSGSGSTALLTEILAQYGAESYIGRCACVCYGSSETVFYISAVYFASIKRKTPVLPIVIALFANLVGAVVGCLLCLVI